MFESWWLIRQLCAAVVLPPALATGSIDTLPPWRLVLNLPATRVALWKDDVLLARYPVAIGQSDFPTPTGAFSIASVEWNPWWIPPASDWAKGQPPTPPGPDNPMGRVKLNFKPLYFLHGSPFDESIGRASSHGCVRLHNADAVDLALRLLTLTNTADSITARLLATDTTTTSTWLLARPVPLAIEYSPVELIGDTLWLHPDPYRRVSGAALAATLDSLLAPVGLARSPVIDSLLIESRIKTIGIALPRPIPPTERMLQRWLPRPSQTRR